MSDEGGAGFTTEEQKTKAMVAATEDLERNAPRVGSFMAAQLEEMKARARQESHPVPVPWPTVGEALGGGLWPGLHVLTGATGTGKTQWALQVAWGAALAGVPVLYVGLELGHLDLAARLLALAEGETMGTPPRWSDLFLGKIRATELERLENAHRNTLAALPFRAEFAPPHGWGAGVLWERVAALRADLGKPSSGRPLPLLVVLDFLQAVGDDKETRRELRERIGRAAYAGRAVARDHQAAVLMLSSVNRDAAKFLRLNTGGDSKEGLEGEEGERGPARIKTPPSELVGLGKESGDIEYAADTVMALASERYDEATHSRFVHLALAKMRAGRPAWCALEFNGSTFSPAPAFVPKATPPPADRKTRNNGKTGRDPDAKDDREPADLFGES